MKKYRYTFFPVFIIMAFGLTNLMAQVNLGIQLSGSSLDMEAPYNNYRTGFKSEMGFVVGDEVKWIKGFSWETGLMINFGQSGFYPLKQGNFWVTNGNYPLNTSEKFLHRFWALNLPVKLRYNAFGFMGILGSFELSYLLDGNIYLPSQSKANRGYNYRNITPLVEGGLFFPIADRFIIEATAFKAIKDRFYTGLSTDLNGNDVDVDGHRDFGFGVNITYRLN